MGSEGYLSTSSSRRAPTSAPTSGAARPRTAAASPSRSSARAREAVGPDFIIIYRLSMLDLVDGRAAPGTRSSRWPSEVEAAGATIINTGIGWHEARVPTIVTVGAARRVHLGHREAAPARSASRSSRPTASTCPTSPSRSSPTASADLVSMARPFLADPDLVRQGRASDRADEINTCIACNQACLDHTFAKQARDAAWSTRAPCHETELVLAPTRTRQARRRRRRRPRRPRRRDRRWPSAATRRAVRGRRRHRRPVRPRACGSPARRSSPRRSATSARRLELGGVKVHLGRRAEVDDLTDFDEVVVATGVVPRDARRPRHRPPEGRDVCRRHPRRGTAGSARGRHRRRRHRLRRRRVPHPRRVAR